MANRSSARERILLLRRIFYEMTDEENTLTMPELIQALARHGVNADRRVIYEDIEELNRCGEDIQRADTGKRGYYLVSRLFDNAEIGIIANALQSSHFLSVQRTDRMLKKLYSLVSPAYRARIYNNLRTVQPKTDNNAVICTIDRLMEAIAENCDISFFESRWNVRKQLVFTSGEDPIIAAPIRIEWDNGSYYLYALTMDEKPMRVRIDRMKEVRKRGASARRRETFISYNDRHQPIQSIVGIKIQLRCKIEKADALLERFGTGVEIYNIQANTFMANLRIVPNDQFYAWTFLNSADVQVVSPAQVADHLCELSAQVLKQYDSQKE